MYTHLCMCIYIDICIERERERCSKRFAPQEIRSGDITSVEFSKRTTTIVQ